MIRLSVRRPVAVAMAYLAVASLGVFAWRNIPIELFPDTRLPRLNVQGTWRGASPETVEAFLTSPLEAAIQLVQGVEKVVSSSSEGSASISIEFAHDTDMDFARLDLSERLATLEENELPPGVDRVVVTPYVPEEFAQQGRALLEYTFTGSRTLESLREHLNDVVVPELTRVEGVAVVRAYGGRERLLEVELDRELMAAMGVSTNDVRRSVGELDLVREAGAIRDGERQWTVAIRDRPESAADIAGTIIKSDQGRLVRVSDVATVRDTYEDVRDHYRVNNRPAVRLTVTKEIGANSVRVADRVKERMDLLEARNPPNTRFILDRDESREIRRQLSDLRSRAVLSVFVILAVLLGFLGSLRSAVVVFASIAFSILISLNLIHFGGLSLNVLTLTGLALVFGLIVDNSIVVLENVYRRWQAGEERERAVLQGVSNVVLPIVAATATTLIVFAPFVYLRGELRIYYLPLALVVVLTLLASLGVAFSFIPALVGRILPERAPGAVSARPDDDHAAGSARPDPGHAAPPGDPGARAAPPGDRTAPPAGPALPLYVRFYKGLVRRTLAWPWMAVAICLAALGGSTYLFQNYVQRGMLWGLGFGQDTYVSIQIRLPRGSDIERTNQLARYFEDRLRQMPEVEEFVTQVRDASTSVTRVTFPEHLEHTGIPPLIKDQLYAYSLGFAGVDVRVYGYGPSFYGGGSSPPNYSIQVLGYNYERVRDIAEELGRRLRLAPRVRDVDTNASYGFFSRDRASEFVVDIRREMAARHNLPVSQLVAQIGAAVRGQVSQDEIKIGGDEVRYDVKIEGNREVDLQQLRQTLVLTPDGDPVRLGELVDIAPRDVLALIRRENQQYERTVAYEFRGPYRMGDTYHEAVINATSVPPGYTVKKADRWRWDTEEQLQVYLVLLLALLLVYMVTAALFESLRQPLCVVLTVPMALIGVFLIFFFLDAQFTREAWMGVIMMCGIVVNNSILLVDHINRIRREDGLDIEAAIMRGTVERVRPILMTTTTTILGLLPLVLFSEHADANIWNALAYVIIGGLCSSTFLVLTATPALYYLFESPAARATLSRHLSASGRIGVASWATQVALYGAVLAGFVFGALALNDLTGDLRRDLEWIDALLLRVGELPDLVRESLVWLGAAWAGTVLLWPIAAATVKCGRGLRARGAGVRP